MFEHMGEMAVQDAVDTINRLRVRAAESGLTASEHQAREAAWAVLERAGVGEERRHTK